MFRLPLLPVLLAIWTGSLLQAQISVTAGDVNAPAGSSVAVPVTIAGGEDVSALQFTLEFDPEILSVAATAPLRGNALSDHVVSAHGEEGSLTVVIFSGSLTPLGQSGTLVSVVFEVADTAQDGATADVEVVDEEGSDSEGFFVNVLGVDGSVHISDEGNVPAEGQNELIFPQIGNGSFGGGKIAVLMIFMNRTQAHANAEIRFFKSDATPFVLKLTDGREESTFSFAVVPEEPVFLETDGSGDLSAGYARLISTAPLGGTLVFTTTDAAEQVLAEAGVGASPVGRHFSIPTLLASGGSANTGIALANVSAGQAEVTLVLRDEFGSELAGTVIFLETGEHLAQFADQFFGLLTGVEEFSGSIEVSSSVNLSAIAIRTQGLLLTTFPVIELF